MAVSLYSEVSPLRRVMMHRPGREIAKLQPDNYRAMLFEDVPYDVDLRHEHDQFVAGLRQFGAEVVLVEDYLEQILHDAGVRQEIVREIAELERCEYLEEQMLRLPAAELLDLAIAGLTSAEAQARGWQVPDKVARDPDADLVPPIPNLYFMRDQAAVVGECVILSNMRFPSRVRENLLVRAVYRHHPEFKTLKPIETPHSIEGGDVLVLSKDAVAIGYGERTSSRSIKDIANELFRRTSFSRVYDVELPKERAYMHLDTVFTLVDEKRAVAHMEIFADVRETRTYVREETHGRVHARLVQRVAHPFKKTLDDDGWEIIPIGAGDRHHAAREQRSEAANLLAVRPGTVFSYGRNKVTNRDLEQRGIRVIPIEGVELVRGAGGPRCMTQPLVRA